jgi:hypothetical protein
LDLACFLFLLERKRKTFLSKITHPSRIVPPTRSMKQCIFGELHKKKQSIYECNSAYWPSVRNETVHNNGVLTVEHETVRNHRVCKIKIKRNKINKGKKYLREFDTKIEYIIGGES